MGYDLGRFVGAVDEELVCPICSGVFEDPVQAPVCEHAYCAQCIQQWLTRQHTCPVDRNPLATHQLKQVPRILRNLLSRLSIGCEFTSYGCSAVVKLDCLTSHLESCDHNPKKPVACEEGCGMVVAKDEMSQHNCVRELRNTITQQDQRIVQLHAEITDLKKQQADHKREMQTLRDYVRVVRCANVASPSPALRALEDQLENSEVCRWSQSLPHARVTRWGGMISTPDAVLQAVIRRVLLDSFCPPHIVDELMDNSHERRWPPGLSTLEMRQLNRHNYEKYLTRRIPGKQAVVVMAHDNRHMGDDFNLQPGLVMIFAHGIE